MATKKIDADKYSRINILLTWIMCLTFAGVIAIFWIGIINTDSISNHQLFENYFNNILIVCILLFFAMYTAKLLSKRLKSLAARSNKTANIKVIVMLIAVIVTLGIVGSLALRYFADKPLNDLEKELNRLEQMQVN